MLTELSIKSLLKENQFDAEELLVNFEESKFVYYIRRSEELVVLYNKNQNDLTFRFSTNSKVFVGINTSANLIVYKRLFSSSVISSVVNFFKRTKNDAFKFYTIFSVAKLKFFDLKLTFELHDIIEVVEGNYLLLNERNQVFEYDSSLNFERKVSDLNFSPKKCFLYEESVVFVGEKSVVKLTLHSWKLSSVYESPNNIENCFVEERFLVTVGHINPSQYCLETINLQKMTCKENVKIDKLADCSIELYLGFVSFFDFDKMVGEKRILVTSKNSIQEVQPEIVHFCGTTFNFHSLQNLKKVDFIQTSLLIPTRNIFLSEVSKMGSLRMNGIMINYEQSSQNTSLIENQKQLSITWEKEMAVNFLKMTSHQIDNFEGFRCFSKIITNSYENQFLNVYSTCDNTQERLTLAILPFFEQILASTMSKSITNLFFFKIDEDYVFQDEGDFFQNVLLFFVKKLTSDFQFCQTFDDFDLLTLKLTNLLSISIAYLQVQKAFVFSESSIPIYLIPELKYQEHLIEIESEIEKIREIIVLISIWEFFLSNNSNEKENISINSEKDMEIESLSVDKKHLNLSKNHQFENKIKKSFSQIFEGVNDSFESVIPEFSSSLEKLLSTVFDFQVQNKRYIDHNKLFLRPRLIFCSLMNESGIDKKITSLDNIFALLSNPQLPTNLKITIVLYYLIKSGEEDLISSFRLKTNLSNEFFDNAKSLIAFDSLIQYYDRQKFSSDALTDEKFTQQIDLFLYLYQPQLNTQHTKIEIMKTASTMEIDKIIVNVHSNEYCSKTENQFELIIKILVSRKMYYQIFLEFEKFKILWKPKNDDQKDMWESELMNKIAAEMKSGDLKIKSLFLNEQDFRPWNPLLKINAQSIYEKEIIEFIRIGEFEKAFQYYEANCHQIKDTDMSLSLKFLVRLIFIYLHGDDNEKKDKSGMQLSLFDTRGDFEKDREIASFMHKKNDGLFDHSNNFPNRLNLSTSKNDILNDRPKQQYGAFKNENSQLLLN